MNPFGMCKKIDNVILMKCVGSFNKIPFQVLVESILFCGTSVVAAIVSFVCGYISLLNTTS